LSGAIGRVVWLPFERRKEAIRVSRYLYSIW
jgi:hypothetical protein